MATNARFLQVYSEPPVAGTASERLERGGGWLTFVLTLVMLASLAEAVNSAAWSDGLSVMRGAVIGGAILGFLLSLTRWDGIFPALYGFLASIVWIVSLIDRTLMPSLNLHDTIQELVIRNIAWGTALVNRQPSGDNLIFVIQVCFLGWWIGYLAIWTLMRHQRVFSAVLPAGLGLLVNVYYAPGKLNVYLIIYLVTVLLLGIRIELARNIARWQLSRIRFAPDIYLDFLRAGIIFASVVVLLAWTAPSLANAEVLERLMRPFEEPWQKVEDTWARMYESLNYQGEPPVVTTFGRSMSFGGPVNLTDRPIFEANTPKPTYWRGAAYDFYTSEGWINTDADVAVLERNETLGEPAFYPHTAVTVTIHPLEQRQDVVFVPPEPIRVNLPLNADITRLPGDQNAEGGAESTQVLVSLLRSRLTLTPDMSYQVGAAFPMATEEDLRVAPPVYPGWVKERYLQLPETVPERVLALAQEITEPYSNVYDKASAVESYLRGFTYNQQIEAPPLGVDGVDYFLFDIQEGYCDYYASAMAVMLRAVDIPARISVGYTPGQYTEPPNGPAGARGLFLVQEQNAHAWPEVWFPEHGWIQFEPTASEAVLVRPTPAPTTEPVGPQETRIPAGGMNDEMFLSEDNPGAFGASAGHTGFAGWFLANWPVATTGTAILLILITVLLVIRGRRRALRNDSNLLGSLFALLGIWAGRLKIPWLPSHTSNEHAAAFRAQVPEAGPAVDRLAAMFVAQEYGRQQPLPDALAATTDEWDQLQPLFWKQWFKQALARLAADDDQADTRGGARRGRSRRRRV